MEVAPPVFLWGQGRTTQITGCLNKCWSWRNVGHSKTWEIWSINHRFSDMMGLCLYNYSFSLPYHIEFSRLSMCNFKLSMIMESLWCPWFLWSLWFWLLSSIYACFWIFVGSPAGLRRDSFTERETTVSLRESEDGRWAGAGVWASHRRPRRWD